MTLSEAFKVKLFCPSCRTKGQAICEEIEADGKFDRLVLAVSNGFEGGGRLDGTDQVNLQQMQKPGSDIGHFRYGSFSIAKS